MRKQYIYIGINECIVAINNKERLEALAFALLVKRTFVDSVVKSTSIRKMTKIFRMGWTRLSKVLNNALRYGYIVKEGDTYFVPSLKQHGSFNKRLECDLKTFSKNEDGRSAFTITAIMKEIRKAVFKNHLRKQKHFHDTALSVNSPCDDKEFYRARGRLKRMCGITSVSDELLKNTRRLSIKKAMKVLGGVSRSTAKNLIKQMIANGEIERRFENIPIGIDHKQIEEDYTWQQAVYKANKLGGHIHIFKSAVYIQVANHYLLSDREYNSITYSPKKK